MVTAELAACLPVLVLLLGVALSAIAVASAHVRTEDAAREAVRVIARGQTTAAAAALVRATAGSSTLSTSRDGGDVTAVVVATVHPFGEWLPAITVTERATAALEPSTDLAQGR